MTEIRLHAATQFGLAGRICQQSPDAGGGLPDLGDVPGEIAGDERGLKRTVALVLQEQPGGRRGFYRNARLCIDGEGNCIRKPRQAVLVVEAADAGVVKWAKAGGVEKKDRRTRKFVPLTEDDRVEGVVPGQIYKVGGVLLRFG